MKFFGNRNRRRRSSAFVLRRLEDRILFDAAIDAGIDPGSLDASATPAAEESLAAMTQDRVLVADDGSQNISTGDLEPSEVATQSTIELILVDTSVENYAEIVDGLLASDDGARSFEIVLLDSSSDGVDQVTEILASRSDLDAVHLISHGEDAALRLGNTWLHSENLAAHAGDVAGWGDALTADGDFIIYGCDVAATDQGEQFVDELAALTGADVAASVDDTGAANRGGDWDLEYTVGNVDLDVAVSAAMQATYQGILAVGPTVTPGADQEVMIGEEFSFNVMFDNTGTDAGYGPYIDLVFPSNGVDGVGGVGADGLSFVAATYLGNALNVIELVFGDDGGGTGTIDHPSAIDGSDVPLQITGTTGDRLFVVELPFGSVTENQPPVDVRITATVSPLADAGVPLKIQTRSGFRYGDSPTGGVASILSDAGSDVTDPDVPANSWNEQLAITPTLMTIEKNYVGPENETATGPNFERQYQIVVDIAEGQTISALDVIDALPDNLVLTGIDSVVVGGVTLSGTDYSSNITLMSAPANNQELIVTLASDVVGTAGDNDVVLTFSYYVSEFDADAAEVIPSTSGEDDNAASQSINNARAVGDWTPIDTRDVDPGNLTDNAVTNPVGPEHTLDDKSIAIQKTVSVVTDTGAVGPTPGDTLEYVLTFQISDYFTFGDLVITDIFQDGQRFDFGYGAEFVIIDSVGNVSDNFTVRQFDDIDTGQRLVVDQRQIDNSDNVGEDGVTDDGSDGSTTLAFDVSGMIQDADPAADGVLQGGLSFNDNDSDQRTAATGTIRFRTIILDNYTDTFVSGDRSVDQGDAITNSELRIDGTVRENAEENAGTGDITRVIGIEDDDSSASVTILTSTMSKEVYAINGNTTLPMGDNGLPVLVAGDRVTYKITYVMPTSDVENLVLTDFLPLPIFVAGDFNADGVSGDVWTVDFDDTTLDAVAGTIELGVNDTFFAESGITPNVVVNSSNGVEIQFGSYDDIDSDVDTIEIFLTIVAQNAPTADGLYLTNIVRASEGTTQQTSTTIDEIVQIEVTQPVLAISKGIVDSDAVAETYSPLRSATDLTFESAGTAPSGTPFSGLISSTVLGTEPIDANITGGIDAGDTVRYVVVIENTGSSVAGAFDVAFQDVLPTGMSYVAGSLQVVNGAGNAVAYTGADADLFTTGIQLTDPGGGQGVIRGYNATSGENVIVLVYDLEATVDVGPNETLVSDVTLTGFAGQEGGANHLAAPLTDAASLVTDNVTATKSLVSTSINVGGNGNFDAVIGELATYTVTFTIPEGTSENTTIVDTLDSGLRFVRQINATAFNVDVENTITPTVSASGRTITWNLGDVEDLDITDGIDGTVTITYEVVVANISSNQAGTQLDNDVAFRVDGTEVVDVSADNRINVIEPTVAIDTTASVAGVANRTTGDAGDAIQYVTTITQTGTIEAFDLGFSDVLPVNADGSSAIVLPIFNMVDSAGTLSPTDFELVGNQSTGYTLQLRSGVDLDLLAADAGRTITITIDGTIANTVTPNQTLGIDPAVSWTSLDGDINDQTIHWTGDTGERDGTDAADNTHDYIAEDPIDVRVDPPTFTKTLVGTNETETTGSDVTIGEQVTYALLVMMPEGTSSNIIITDLIPAGLDYLSYSIITDAASSGGLLTADYNGTLPTPTVTGGTGNGSDVTFTFGTTDTAVDNIGTNDSFVILIETVVLDVASNEGHSLADQTTLANRATIDVIGDGVAAIFANGGTPVNVDVVESNLAITKNIVAAQANAGDTMTINLDVTNTGLSDAYEVDIRDVINSGHYDLSTVTVTSSAAGFTTSYDAGTGALEFTDGTLGVGTTATFTFTAELLETVATDAVLLNTATITQASTLQGTVAGERDETDSDGDGSDTDNDSVRIREHSLGGFVYFDADNDGIRDGGETGIGNVDVTLTGVDHLNNTINTTVQTNASGVYFFDDLRPGTYTITQTQPLVAANGKDYLDGTDTIGTPGGNTANDVFSNIVLPLTSEIDGANNNFGELEEIDLTGFVYHDLDNDGINDVGELGISGVRITLTGTDDNGAITTQTFDTLADGSYSFDQLRPGTYTLTQTQITGNAPSGRAWIDGRDSDGNYGNGNVTVNDINSSINLAAGNTGIDYNFAEVVESVVSGYVFHDTENDGSRVGNVGLGGVTVTLTGSNDLGQVVNESTTTSTNAGTLGYYEFANLRPSNGAGYVITQTTPSGYLDGIDTLGSQGGSAANDAFTSVVLSDVNGTENNFGEVLPSSLSGLVFNDKNSDGLFNGTDEPIENVDVTLTGLDDLGIAVNTTVQTLADGTYEFTNLRPSNAAGYTITQTQPADYNDGIHSDGSLANGDNTASNTLTSINLNEDTDGTDYNFAERGIGIGGTVFVDNDRDGVLDAGETVRIDNVRIDLYDATGTILLETQFTGTDGTYLFTDRPAADYVVVQTQPGEYTTTSSNTLNVTLPLTDISGQNFAEALWDIGDTVYFDQNGNNVQDGTEPGIGGVSVTLTFAGLDGVFGTGNETTLNMMTDATGAYEFTELFNGNYRVTIDAATLPTGLTATQELDDVLAAIDGISNITILDDDRDQVDFGFVGTGSIGNAVWLDINGDGTRQAGEIGIADSDVDLRYAGFDGVFNTTDDFLLSTSTDSAGVYRFDNLPAGIFRVDVDTADPQMPTDLVASPGVDSIAGTANVTLTTSEINHDIDFGFVGTLSIGDRVFIDHEADGGNFDAATGDRGIGGVSVSLDIDYDGDGTFDHTLTTTSDADGLYRFDTLIAGDYRVRVDSSGLGDNVATTTTYDVDAAHDDQTLISLGIGTDDFSADFGYPGIVEYAVTNVSSLTDVARGGDVFTYEVTVTNQGERDGTGVVVVDTFPMDVLDPAGMGHDRPGEAVWNFGDGTLVWDVGDLDIGESETIIVTVAVRRVPLDPLADQIVTTARVFDDTFNGPEITLLNNVAPTLDGLVTFTFDSFTNYGEWDQNADSGDRDDEPVYGWVAPSAHRFERELRPVAVDPIFSGLAEPGTTLSIRIYDETGRLIGDRQVVADTGGNWLASFPGSVIWKQPHRMEIEQVASIENSNHDAGFNLRRYFHPANHASLVMTERPTVRSVLRETAYETIDVMHNSHNDPLQLGKKAHGYQLNTASTNVSSH